MIAIISSVKFATIGAILGIAIYYINKKYILKSKNKKLALICAIITFLIILIPSIIGSIEFATKHPFM